ncbi:zinc finger protein 492-like isoform X2 [Bradysia coprophila]|uniref:zinc finger protein 492-like isoform X2 n=1 Tax=Bradysia coprophila TaxID=38358 RepID=UPI00187DACAD|nr:zinc finger protein 492-like isoform X2 [Bradysia coprophila]
MQTIVKMTERFDLKFEDFIAICRLCCNKGTGLIPIFPETEDVSNNVTEPTDSIPAMLLKIGLSVRRNDGLPEALCSDCHIKLLNCNNFRVQCLSTAVYLQEILTRHTECIVIRNETAEDDDGNNFQDCFEVDYILDNDELDTTNDVEFTNGRVEALDITIQNENSTEIHKRKRGRPKSKVEKPPPVEQNKTTKSSKGCKSSHNKKRSNRKDICLICGKVINNNIKGHQAIHDKSETFYCDICGFKTNVKLYMKNHMNKIHVAQRKYPCPHCHLVFMHSVTLKRHATIHSGEKNYVCEECGKSYRQRDMLLAHRKRHLPPTIQCSFCDKLFYSKNELKSHTGLHTGIKAYKCDLCTAAFVASSLAAHRRQHKRDNVLPSCKICGMMFSDRLVYNMHLMDHKRTNQSIAYSGK